MRHRIGVTEHHDSRVGVDDVVLAVGDGFEPLFRFSIAQREKFPRLEIVAGGRKRRRLEDTIERRLVDLLVAVVMY